MLSLALSQGLVEAVAERQVGLTLSTVQKLFDFPGAGTSWFTVALSSSHWGRSCGLWCIRTAATKCSSQCMPHGVSNRWTLEKKLSFQYTVLGKKFHLKLMWIYGKLKKFKNFRRPLRLLRPSAEVRLFRPLELTIATPPAVAAIWAISPGPWDGAAIGAIWVGGACWTIGGAAARGAGAGADLKNNQQDISWWNVFVAKVQSRTSFDEMKIFSFATSWIFFWFLAYVGRLMFIKELSRLFCLSHMLWNWFFTNFPNL